MFLHKSKKKAANQYNGKIRRKTAIKTKRFRVREEQTLAALHTLHRAVANRKTKANHPDTACSKTLIQEKKTIYSRVSKMFI